VAARHAPTIRQNPMVARRIVLDAVDEALAAVESVIARRESGPFSPPHITSALAGRREEISPVGRR
jgi:hypothetical protein